jgi:DNA mismatch endonuclease (patch repair protein)
LRCRVDVVFTRVRVAVFIDGCFWHSCPEHGTSPEVNTEYWAAKLARNRERDARNNEALEAAGWHVVRVWEHEDPEVAAARIAAAVATRRRCPELENNSWGGYCP